MSDGTGDRLGCVAVLVSAVLVVLAVLWLAAWRAGGG